MRTRRGAPGPGRGEVLTENSGTELASKLSRDAGDCGRMAGAEANTYMRRKGGIYVFTLKL